MLQLQDAMNSRVNPQWRSAGNAWYRAIWIESAELLEHYGWKWWKAQHPDMEQVKLELIDIWHFGLSIELEKNLPLDRCAEGIVARMGGVKHELPFREAIEAFASSTLRSREFDIAGFVALMAGADLSFDELFRQYVGKNVLNIFRQDHGYKEGSYQKLWQGREDNVHLVEVMDSLDSGSDDFRDRL